MSRNIHATLSGPKPEGEPAQVNLVLPKVWTRLVVAIVGLLFLCVIMVSVVSYTVWRTAQRNVRQIEEIKARLQQIEAQMQRK